MRLLPITYSEKLKYYQFTTKNEYSLIDVELVNQHGITQAAAYLYLANKKGYLTTENPCTKK